MCANIVSHFHKSRTCELPVKTKVDTCIAEDLVRFFPSGEHVFTFRVDVYFSARWHQEIKGCTMGSCFVRPEELPSSAEIRPPPPHPPPPSPQVLELSTRVMERGSGVMEPLSISPEPLSITPLAGYFQPLCWHGCGDL